MCIFRFLIIFFSFFIYEAKAQLYINEINQGPGGTPPNEYVELVVVGTKTCSDSCANIQNWIIDDNNGFFWSKRYSCGTYPF